MKTAHEWFLTLGVPFTRIGTSTYAGFRGFNEHDIAVIQDEAFKAGQEQARLDAKGAAIETHMAKEYPDLL